MSDRSHQTMGVEFGVNQSQTTIFIPTLNEAKGTMVEQALADELGLKIPGRAASAVRCCFRVMGAIGVES